MEEQNQEKFIFRHYKKFFVVPAVILIVSIAILANSYIQTGELFKRSIELKGGTLISLVVSKPVDTDSIERSLSEKFGSLSVRELTSFSGYGVLIETSSDVDSQGIIKEIGNLGISVETFSIQTMGPSLGGSFWIQAQLGLVIAFILMAITVFVIFRTLIPSLAVISSAVLDIFFTIAFMQIFNIELSLASLAALLMLIGYSVDTDILLTARSLRGSGIITERLSSAFKTGITMTLTAIGALTALLVYGISPVLTQIASVLVIGLAFDIVNTWITNVGLLRMYMERKGIV